MSEIVRDILIFEQLVERHNFSVFRFTSSGILKDWRGCECSCGIPLSSVYTYLMWKLYSVGLISNENRKLMCCRCYHNYIKDRDSKNSGS